MLIHRRQSSGAPRSGLVRNQATPTGGSRVAVPELPRPRARQRLCDSARLEGRPEQRRAAPAHQVTLGMTCVRRPVGEQKCDLAGSAHPAVGAAQCPLPAGKPDPAPAPAKQSLDRRNPGNPAQPPPPQSKAWTAETQASRPSPAAAGKAGRHDPSPTNKTAAGTTTVYRLSTTVLKATSPPE